MNPILYTLPYGSAAARFIAAFMLILLLGESISDYRGPMSLIPEVPVRLLLLYLTVALWINKRQATITDTGITITVAPLPAAPKRTIPRADVAYAYARRIVIMVEGKESSKTHVAGVATHTNELIDLSGPHPDIAVALAYARQLSVAWGIRHENRGNDVNPTTPNDNKKRWAYFFALALSFAFILDIVF